MEINQIDKPGRCARCNRPIKRQYFKGNMGAYGSTCVHKVSAAEQESIEFEPEPEPEQTETAQIKDYQDDIVCQRSPYKKTNVPHREVYHSPDGFEWGYGGSGAAEFALNILLLFVDRRTALELHQEFKRQFIAGLPYSGGVIANSDIRNWLKGQL